MAFRMASICSCSRRGVLPRPKTRAGGACAKQHRICASLTGVDEPRLRRAGTAASGRAGSAFPRPRAGAGANPAAAIPGRRHRTRSRPSQRRRQGGAFGASSGDLPPFRGFPIATIYRLRPGLHRAPDDRLRLAVCSARYSRCLSRRQAARASGQAIAARFGSDSSGWLGEKNGAGRESDRGGRRNGGTRRAESMARLAAGRAIVAGGAPASRTECAASCPALPCRGGWGSPAALSLAAVRGRLRVRDFAAKLDRAPLGALLVLFYGVGV